jgi:hypothetical protein
MLKLVLTWYMVAVSPATTDPGEVGSLSDERLSLVSYLFSFVSNNDNTEMVTLGDAHVAQLLSRDFKRHAVNAKGH